MRSCFMMAGVCLLLLFSAFLSKASVAQQRQAYFVGNSLTWDMLAQGGLETVFNGSLDVSFVASQNIRCGRSLTQIIEFAASSPSEPQTCVSTNSSFDADFDLGEFGTALQSNFDDLVLQPFYNVTLQQEIDSAKYLIDLMRQNPNNAGNRVFIYATSTHRADTATFVSNWYGHEATLDGAFIPSESTYQLLQSELASAGYETELIPVGHAYAEVAGVFADGASVGNLNSVNYLYRDSIHASNAGRYLSSLVAAGTISGQSILEVEDCRSFSQFNRAGHGFSADSYASAELRSIAQSTIDGVPTLRGDVNLDGNVDFFDISPFISTVLARRYRNEADINRDGVVGFLDISPFTAILSGVPTLRGDVNLDGSVNFFDISAFVSVLVARGFQDEADINQDGAVDFLDVSPFVAILRGPQDDGPTE